MDKQPLVSVIIPVYNAERFISEAIESVLQQSYQTVEIILINDGSTDGSGRICRNYSAKDNRIRYYEKRNSGVSDTRNLGIDYANGEYIFFVDADDSMTEDAIEVFIGALSESQCDVVYAGHRNVYDNTSVDRLMRMKNGVYTYQDIQDRLLDDGTMTGILFGSVCGACYRAAVLKERKIRFHAEIRVNEDGLFNIELIHGGGRVKVIDNIVYNYRQWKATKKIPLRKDVRFELSEPAIASVIEKFGDKDLYEIQLKRRQVCIAFWNALRIVQTDASCKECLAYLRSLFSEKGLQNGYAHLDYSKMNSVKKMLCCFMKYRFVTLFYLSVKYVSPVLSKVMKR